MITITPQIAAMMAATDTIRYRPEMRGLWFSPGRVRASNGSMLVHVTSDYDGPPAMLAYRGPKLRAANRYQPEETVTVDLADWGDTFGPRAYLTSRGRAVVVERLEWVFPDSDAVLPTEPILATVGLDLSFLGIVQAIASTSRRNTATVHVRGRLEGLTITTEAGFSAVVMPVLLDC